MASAAAVTPLGIASYETTSALATLPGPGVGMVPRYTASRYLPAVSPLPQPLDRPCLSTGRGAPRTRCPGILLSQQMPPARDWGATCNGQAASGLWTGPRLLWHINCLELWAVHLALRQFRPLLLGKHVLVRTDNTAAVSYITRLGGILSQPHVTARPPFPSSGVTCSSRSLRAVHIPGAAQSCGPTRLSRQLTFPGEWRLHPETIRLICESIRGSSGRPVASPSPPTANCTSP